jgi:hypothetical protein
MNSPVTSVTGLGHIDEQSSRDSSFGGKLVAKQFGTFSTASTRFRHGRPIFAVTHNTAPHANDVVGYGCRSQAVPLTFAPSVAIRSRRSEAFSLQGSSTLQ